VLLLCLTELERCYSQPHRGVTRYGLAGLSTMLVPACKLTKGEGIPGHNSAAATLWIYIQGHADLPVVNTGA